MIIHLPTFIIVVCIMAVIYLLAGLNGLVISILAAALLLL